MKIFIWPALTVAGIIGLTTIASRPFAMTVSPASSEFSEVLKVRVDDEILDRVNQELFRLRSEASVELSAPADELQVLRRLSLALHGTIPSLEELRKFQADQSPQRLLRRIDQMLKDDRFAEYFAERLARSFVGVENGQFIIFRRDRFLSWLATQLRENRPYDDIVRQMISGTGVWTGAGEVNFLTAAFADDEFDPNKLTARATRAFLGQRMDCVQCHDSKIERDEYRFQEWKQSDFHGIAAHFSQLELSLAGVIDNQQKEHVYESGGTFAETEIAPSVPFHPEWMGDAGSRRERLARWMTHPENQRFERATANRIWGLLFGTPFLANHPVDDLPDPGTDDRTQLLDILGADFRTHGYDLQRMIQVIVISDAFQMSSISPYDELSQNSTAELGASDDAEELLRLSEENWALFPLVRLRPEQVIGSMLQANSIRTIHQNSHLIVRAMRFFRENDFVDEFGDPGVNELQAWSGTIPQALLRMNGQLSRELTELNPFFAPGRIAATASSPEKVIETCYLACLTRSPTEAELSYFLKRFEDGERNEVIVDLYWTLFNSPEFSWNH